ncbi:fused isobutyryl-CoA mutase/GTPase IcmF [Mesoterricola sediminis]|uniref:Fused isobutyryl-CoA mutase n=1 Tax=Mesoterricola sediminis TaxID=2927980 RepID=A0AA48GLU6_9BACT|nr:fused isobutyryl-CoA mutase/GTPase IcmF [Mesoterricola sediminis]BDU75461.1 Fused isobutyryl-CoA mutase [Mesoterricola sediminis]
MKGTDQPIRIITAAALFDGHDAAINLVRRLLVAQGAQVVHLGHNRGVDEIVKAAVEEDADAVCVSSYQGGHVDFFTYLARRLREAGAGHVRVFGGGGGVILPAEAAALEAAGVEKIYTPDDGMRLGVDGMIADLLGRARSPEPRPRPAAAWSDRPGLARALGAALDGGEPPAPGSRCPVIGFTGTGGAGKSSLVDELVRRLLLDHPDLRVAVLAIDPTRKASGGALLGDRLRMGTASDPRVFFRSVAGGPDLAARVRAGAAVLQAAGASLVLVETSGIGQADTEITEMSDLPVYVMTSDFGAGTQLEKINMLDFARLVVVNKFEDKRSEDALHAVRRQVRRNRGLPAQVPDEALPVYGTVAGHFDDPGVDRLYLDLLARLREDHGLPLASALPDPGPLAFSSDRAAPIVPFGRARYLQEIVSAVRAYHRDTEALAAKADRLQALETAAAEVPEAAAAAARARADLGPEGERLLARWEALKAAYGGDAFTYAVRDREVKVPLTVTSLAGTPVRKVELPATDRYGDLVRFLRLENVPGSFPFTAGVFPFRRTDEDPKRQFAGEGGPERTNRRFHFLCQGDASRRLSTAFDSVTLYGEDPHERPDIYGKIGESGVSVATLDDMKRLFQGFDLCDPATSVSMTINGPAPVILAMFFNAAVDQQLEKRRAEGPLTPVEEAQVREASLAALRGTVQADILKEDQAQNTCIFSIEFALKMMGDVQDFIVRNRMRNYYSVSVSGYHIAEAGANPVTQLAFTLANGFTLVEYYLSRGMAIDDIAPSLSFFFSSGLDPEYSVLGRVARRIWAVALRDVYGARERNQKLKYHIQTSGRSLHLKEMKFNDIRTTLQALTALLDNCNSLHTNAYDEALTTPTEESVRIAMAIQLILTREWGVYWSENALQGSHFFERLTARVEEAVLEEFLALDARGGVLRAMETQYQRYRIQEQSLLYETRKHSGELPVVGVNTFVRDAEEAQAQPISRASAEEKDARLASLRAFQARHREAAGPALDRLRDQIRRGANVFDVLMDTVRVASLGQITSVLYEMGGKYRRSM